jgi:hypothetical protein
MVGLASLLTGTVRRTKKGEKMNRLLFGVVAGLAFGILAVLLMIPLEMDDKATALMPLSWAWGFLGVPS